jgi:hypothetical protein
MNRLRYTFVMAAASAVAGGLAVQDADGWLSVRRVIAAVVAGVLSGGVLYGLQPIPCRLSMCYEGAVRQCYEVGMGVFIAVGVGTATAVLAAGLQLWPHAAARLLVFCLLAAVPGIILPLLSRIGAGGK